MRLNFKFSNPYTRQQVQTALSNRNSFLPSAAVTTIFIAVTEVDIDSVIDPSLDLVKSISIDGFSSLDEVATFIASLPVEINSRLETMAYF